MYCVGAFFLIKKARTTLHSLQAQSERKAVPAMWGMYQVQNTNSTCWRVIAYAAFLQSLSCMTILHNQPRYSTACLEQCCPSGCCIVQCCELVLPVLCCCAPWYSLATALSALIVAHWYTALSQLVHCQGRTALPGDVCRVFMARLQILSRAFRWFQGCPTPA